MEQVINMNAPTLPETPLRRRWLLAAAYIVGVGLLYQLGYWSTFDVNVFDYVNLTDIAKASIYPLLIFGLVMVIGVATGALISKRKQLSSPKPITPDPDAMTRLRLLFVYTVGSGLILVLSRLDQTSRWATIPVLLGAMLGLSLWVAGVFSTTIRSDSVRRALLIALSVLPCASYGHGKTNALGILDGIRYQYVADCEWTSRTAVGKTVSGDKYLGFAGGYFFLLSADNTVLRILSQQSTGRLNLRSFDKWENASLPTTTRPSPSTQH
jgi:hypothetical protein